MPSWSTIKDDKKKIVNVNCVIFHEFWPLHVQISDMDANSSKNSHQMSNFKHRFEERMPCIMSAHSGGQCLFKIF